MKEALGSLKYFGIEEEDLNIIATFDSAEMLRVCGSWNGNFDFVISNDKENYMSLERY